MPISHFYAHLSLTFCGPRRSLFDFFEHVPAAPPRLYAHLSLFCGFLGVLSGNLTLKNGDGTIRVHCSRQYSMLCFLPEVRSVSVWRNTCGREMRV